MLRARAVTLESRSIGVPTPESFRLVDAALPAIGPGEVLVRNRWLSIDPAVRGRMYAAKSYIPPFEIGDVIAGPAVGEVLESADPDFSVGDTVISDLGWCEAGAAAGSTLEKVPSDGLPPQAYLGIAGITGLTAYVGLTRIAALKAGDVVFVSAGSGAVGSTACLIAKRMGHKVVASVGSEAKAAFLRDEIGVDATINYRAEPNLRNALYAAAPEGIDVCLDNVGGLCLEAVIGCANPYARFAICGMISGYNATEPVAAPRNMTLLPVKRIEMKGFIVFDHMDLMPSYRAKLEQWQAAETLVWKETVADGLESAPGAFIGLFAGDNIGKMLVRLP